MTTQHDVIERNVALQAERSEDVVPFRPASMDVAEVKRQPEFDNHIIPTPTKVKQRELTIAR